MCGLNWNIISFKFFTLYIKLFACPLIAIGNGQRSFSKFLNIYFMDFIDKQLYTSEFIYKTQENFKYR